MPVKTSSLRLHPRAAADFRRDPYGGYVSGSSWFYFAFDPDLFGYVIWGRPTADDVRALVKVLEAELDRPPHAAVVDLAGLTAVDADAFAVLAAYTVEHSTALAHVVRETAIVRPPGINGAIVAGFFDVSSKPFPVLVAASTEEAFAKIGRTEAAEYASALSCAETEITGEPPLLRALQFVLRASLVDPSPAAAAKRLGLTSRTMQRRLAESATSFGAEVKRARLAAAKERLLDTEAPVTTIALDVGFATAQQFATAFRAATGVAPSEFRSGRGERAFREPRE